MKFTRMTQTGLVLSTLVTTALLAGGCQKNHEKWVNQADNRWLELRSNLKLEMAQQRFETGDLDQAEVALKEAMGYDPTNPKLLTLAGRIALERGELERAYHLFETAIEQDTNLEEQPQGKLKLHAPRYYQGIVFQRWQNYQGARDRYREAYEINADNASYLTAWSEMLVELDSIDEAIELLESKLTYFDQNAGIRATLAHLHGIAGDHARSVEYFKEASMLDPDNVKMHEELATAQFKAGFYKDCASTIEQMIADPEVKVRTDLMRLRAKAYLEAGDNEKAREAYLDLTRRPDAEASDWINLGELAWKVGDVGGTMTAANKAIGLDGRRHEGYLLAGMVWQKRNRLDDALRAFDRAAELAPQSAVPLILRGIALQRAGRTNAAAEAYSEALKRRPDDTRAKRLLEGLAVVGE